MDPKVQELRDRLDAIQADQQNIINLADSESRPISDEENDRISAMAEEFARVSREIESRKKVHEQAVAMAQSRGRVTQPDKPAGATQPEAPAATASAAKPSISVLDPRYKYAGAEGKHGFRSMGEWFKSALKAAVPHNGVPDERIHLFNSTTSYQGENVGTDGGFLVPPDFRAEIMSIVGSVDSLFSRTDRMQTSSNEMTFPIDDIAPWNSSSGAQAYWDGEGAAITESKHAAKKDRVQVDKLTMMVNLTEELREDASAAEAWIRRTVTRKIDSTVNTAIVRGNGVGQPMGILNSPCLVSVTKTGSQVAATFTADNVVKMFARLDSSCRGNAVWLVNQDVEHELQFLMKQGKLDTGAVTTGWGVPLYIQPGGLSGSPYGTLLGKPVIPVQACSTLGTVGDVILADLSQYRTITKTGQNGPRIDTSIHFYFNQDLTSLRVVYRIGGKPWWPAAISPQNGSATTTCFVVTETRA